MSVTSSYKQKGLTLLETLLALAVAIIIVGGILLFFRSIQNSSNIAATIKTVGNISDAVRTYAQTSSYAPGSISLSTLQSQGLLTANDRVNPWSSSTSPTVFTSGNYMGIYFNSVPGAASNSGICANLAQQLSSSLPLPAPGSATLNGVTYNITSTAMTGTWPTTACGGTTCPIPSGNAAAVCQGTSGGPLAIIMDLS
ncbi:MAG: hypothetical protein K0R48_295 [Gammaproteobacteria bacterium]|nr:hypothetical protein [Gammaproteobacteria bacterium]